MEREVGLYGGKADSPGCEDEERGTCGMGKPGAESGESGCSGLGLREDSGASHQGGKEGWRSQVSKARVHLVPRSRQGNAQR